MLWDSSLWLQVNNFRLTYKLFYSSNYQFHERHYPLWFKFLQKASTLLPDKYWNQICVIKYCKLDYRKQWRQPYIAWWNINNKQCFPFTVTHLTHRCLIMEIIGLQIRHCTFVVGAWNTQWPPSSSDWCEWTDSGWGGLGHSVWWVSLTLI